MRKANLMLHCGANAVELGQVLDAPTPERTGTWVPIPHATLLAGVRGSLERSGLAVVAESHGLSHDGNRYFGLLQIAGKDGAEDGDFGLIAGVRNSHDKTFPAGLCLGAQVFVCDNLSFSGEVRLSRRHTAHIERDLPLLVDRAVGLLGGLRRTQEERFAAYRNSEIPDGRAHDLLVQTIDAQALPVTRLPAVLKEWREPSHPEFREGGKTLWRLFNSLTEVLKGSLDQLPRRTQAVHGIFDAACGLVVPTSYRSEDAEIMLGQAG
jgi:hypothetical protein